MSDDMKEVKWTCGMDICPWTERHRYIAFVAHLPQWSSLSIVLPEENWTMSQANRRYVCSTWIEQWNWFTRCPMEFFPPSPLGAIGRAWARKLGEYFRQDIWQCQQSSLIHVQASSSISLSCEVTLVLNHHHLALSDLLRDRRKKNIKYFRSNIVKICLNSDEIPSLHSDLTSENRRHKLTDDIVWRWSALEPSITNSDPIVVLLEKWEMIKWTHFCRSRLPYNDANDEKRSALNEMSPDDDVIEWS